MKSETAIWFSHFVPLFVPLSVSATLLVSCASALKSADRQPGDIVVETEPQIWPPSTHLTAALDASKHRSSLIEKDAQAQLRKPAAHASVDWAQTMSGKIH